MTVYVNNVYVYVYVISNIILIKLVMLTKIKIKDLIWYDLT